MKHFSLLLSLFYIIAIQAQAQEQIVFFEGKWAEALEKAKQMDKIIFVDAYTSWCAPCKKMDKVVFNQKEVADYYNRNFLNVKMHMERMDGIRFGKTYTIYSYPTFLFITPSGELLHKAVGYHDPQQFLELAKKTKKPEEQLSTMEKRFEAGERSPDFLYKYTLTRFDLGDHSHGAIADAYLATQSNWDNEKTQTFILSYTTSPKSKAFSYILNNRTAFNDSFGAGEVNERILEIIHHDFHGNTAKNDEGKFKYLGTAYQEAFPKKAPLLLANFKMNYYRDVNDKQAYTSAAEEFVTSIDLIEDKKLQSEHLNQIAWFYYEQVDKRPQLEKALDWSKRSVELDETYYNLDTVASLYSKLGKKRKARCYAKKAIKKAKATGVDASETQKLLKQL